MPCGRTKDEEILLIHKRQRAPNTEHTNHCHLARHRWAQKMIFSVEVCVDRLADQFCRARSSLGIAGLVRERHGREIEHHDAGLRFRLEIGVYYDEPDGAWCPEACPVVLARLILEDNCGQLHQHLRDADSRREGECVVRCLNAGNSLWCFAENDASVPIEHTGVESATTCTTCSAPRAQRTSYGAYCGSFSQARILFGCEKCGLLITFMTPPMTPLGLALSWIL